MADDTDIARVENYAHEQVHAIRGEMQRHELRLTLVEGAQAESLKRAVQNATDIKNLDETLRGSRTDEGLVAILRRLDTRQQEIADAQQDTETRRYKDHSAWQAANNQLEERIMNMISPIIQFVDQAKGGVTWSRSWVSVIGFGILLASQIAMFWWNANHPAVIVQPIIQQPVAPMPPHKSDYDRQSDLPPTYVPQNHN